jgi:hypothetical protein
MAVERLLRGWRRRSLAAVTTALAAAALAVAVGGRGCNTEDGSPLGAVRAFAAAARAGNREAMYALLGPETRHRLELAAARATQLVSSRQYGGADMIRSVVPSGSRTFELVKRSEDRALVAIVDQRGARTSVNVVRVGDRWRLELLGP